MSCCKFCIYTQCHVVNFVFTPTQLIQNIQLDIKLPYFPNYPFNPRKIEYLVALRVEGYYILHIHNYACYLYAHNYSIQLRQLRTN